MQAMCACYRHPGPGSLQRTEPQVVAPRTLNFGNVVVSASPPASSLLASPPPRQEPPGSIRSPLLLRSPQMPPRTAPLPAASGVLPLVGHQLQSPSSATTPAAAVTSTPLQGGPFSHPMPSAQATALLTSPSRYRKRTCTT